MYLTVRQNGCIVTVDELVHQRPNAAVHVRVAGVLGDDLVKAEALTLQISLDLVRLRVHRQRMACPGSNLGIVEAVQQQQAEWVSGRCGAGCKLQAVNASLAQPGLEGRTLRRSNGSIKTRHAHAGAPRAQRC
jgi:hypothetical protein